MNTKIVESSKGILARYTMEEEGEIVASVPDFLDLIASCQADTIVLDRGALAEDFFELRSGLAGDILQKVSNYRKRLVVLGDFSAVASRALRDFIFESNRTGKVVFAEEIGQAIALLR
jgi:hypothetical protein